MVTPCPRRAGALPARLFFRLAARHGEKSTGGHMGPPYDS